MGRYRENANWGAQNLVEFVRAVKQALAGVTGAVRYDVSQGLTEEEQAQGRSNICAAKAVEATTTSHGLMSAEDKTKLDGLQPVASTGSYNDLYDKPAIPAEYVLPAATASSLGGIIVGEGLDVDNGSVSVGSAYVTSSSVSSIAADVADSVVSSAGFVTSSGASAIVSGYVDAGGYVTSSGVVSVVDSVILSGGYATSAYVSSAVADKVTSSQALDAVSGAGYATSSNVSSIAGDLIASSAYSLPKATSSTMGGVIIGSGVSVDSNGVISVSGGGGSSGGYVLPPATTSSLGGVIIGSGLSVVSDGTLSVGSDYVTSSGASDIVATYVSGGGYATSAYVSGEVSSAVSDKITSAQALQAVSSGGYATSSWVTSQGYATTSYVSSATVASAGAATSAGSAGSAGVAAKIGTSTVGSTSQPVYISAGVPVSMSVVGSATAATSAGTCTGNAATATDASSLGGVAASSYALDADVVKKSGAQEVGGAKTFTAAPKVQNNYPMFEISKTGDTLNVNPSDIRFTIDGDGEALLRLSPNKVLTIGLKAGTSGWTSGPMFELENDGQFVARAQNSTTGTILRGKPDGTLTWGGSNVNTAAKPGVQLVEYNDSTSRTLNAHGGAQYTFEPPSISGYTAKEVVGGRGNGSTGILVGCWNDPTKAWVHNCNTASKTFTVTYLILYTRN